MRFKPGIKVNTPAGNTISESSLFIIDYMTDYLREPPKIETEIDIQHVITAMKMVKNGLSKEGVAQKAWQETKNFLQARWTKLIPTKNKAALKNWQKALDDFKKL